MKDAIAVLATMLFIGTASANTVWVDKRSGPNVAFTILSFRAIDSLYTHAYIAVYSQSDTSLTSSQRYVGFNPLVDPQGGIAGALADMATAIIGTNGGTLLDEDDEVVSSPVVAGLNLVIDSELYESKVAPVIGAWVGKKYQVLLRDCTTFLSDVAEASGASAPSRATNWFPIPYVKELVSRNSSSVDWQIGFSNIDDRLEAVVNGSNVGGCGLGANCAISLNAQLKSGKNSVQIRLQNVGGPYHYRFVVNRNGVPWFQESCGAPGQSCNTHGGPFPVGTGQFNKFISSFDIFR